jgi:thiosulfate/3-mercaptopyruvate sulfurtransferase
MVDLVSVTWLKNNMDKVIIIDATNDFLDQEVGRLMYKKVHIPNAYHLDLKDDLSSPTQAHGGRHPLTDLDKFKNKLESIGVNNNSEIVVYDTGLMYSTRFWWMCNYYSFTNVKILDGCFKAWQDAGYPISDQITPLPELKSKLDLKIKSEMIVDYQDILSIIANKDNTTILVDSRSNERFAGLDSSVDVKPGHIPTAVNYFFQDVINEDGKYKSVAELKEHFKDILKYQNIIFYCGSGISATVNAFALYQLGRTCKIYIGSYSDYESYPDAKISK